MTHRLTRSPSPARPLSLQYALREVMTNFHVAFCFVFPYSFQFLVSFITEWAPHWAPVCLWYSFLVQFFCTSGAVRGNPGGTGGKGEGSGGEGGKDGKGSVGKDGSGGSGNGAGNGSSDGSGGGGGGVVTFFRLVLPLAFVAEGVSGRSYLLDLSGAELLLVSFFLAALKMQCATR